MANARGPAVLFGVVVLLVNLTAAADSPKGTIRVEAVVQNYETAVMEDFFDDGRFAVYDAVTLRMVSPAEMVDKNDTRACCYWVDRDQIATAEAWRALSFRLRQRTSQGRRFILGRSRKSSMGRRKRCDQTCGTQQDSPPHRSQSLGRNREGVGAVTGKTRSVRPGRTFLDRRARSRITCLRVWPSEEYL